MAEYKNLESLRNEVEQKKLKLQQTERQLNRTKNQLFYREGLSRKARNHRLIICGAIFEKYFPMIRDLTEPELAEILSISDIAGFTSELSAGISKVRREV